MIRSVILAALALAQPALGQTLPDPGFFAGAYEATGRMPGASGAPFVDWMHIDGDLNLTSCRLGTGKLVPATEIHEGAAPYEGNLGSETLFCRFQVDGDNYPRLTCIIPPEGGEIPGLLTLWPAHWPRPTHARDCP